MSTNEAVRWGILGTGDICRQFTHDLQFAGGAVVHAVGSRKQETADAFAQRHGIPVAYGSYEALVADPAIDVVYVGSPHTCHLENTMLCLESGKHVLCEKPLGINAREVDRMFSTAASAGLFLMEAMWTYFIPAVVRVREWLTEGRIGRPLFVRADFHFHGPFAPDSRLYDPEYAGGSLLDVGIYPIALAQMVFETTPKEIKSAVNWADSGVDLSSAMVCSYEGGGMALLSCGFDADAPEAALIVGERGSIELPRSFFNAETATLTIGDDTEAFTFVHKGFGYEYEAEHVTQCIREGRTESPVVPASVSEGLIGTMDRIRADWNLQYPGDRA